MNSKPSQHNWLSWCPECHNRHSPRMNFQWWAMVKAQGPVLNVGCSEDPLKFGDKCVHFDIDDWGAYFNKLGQTFVQGDAHKLDTYFEPGSFDTIVLGDIAEHLGNPLEAFAAAARVTRRALCLTIWEEWRLPGVGRWVNTGQAMGNEEAQKQGYDTYEAQQVLTYPDRVGYDDKELPHLVHIWQFSNDMVTNAVAYLCNTFDMTAEFFEKVPEIVHEGHQVHNWLVYLVKDEAR